MKPVWKANEFRVELHKPDITRLEHARDIGAALMAMNVAAGATLVAAIEEVYLACVPRDVGKE